MNKETMLRSEFETLCVRFGIPSIPFVINPRLRTTAGRFCFGEELRVEHAKNHMEKFDLEECLKVVRHEFAHYYRYRWYNDTRHSPEFKEFCARIGGSMNEQMAGEKYAHAATVAFVKSEYKWKYVCECGNHVRSSKRRLAVRELRKWCCSKCKKSMLTMAPTPIN